MQQDEQNTELKLTQHNREHNMEEFNRLRPKPFVRVLVVIFIAALYWIMDQYINLSYFSFYVFALVLFLVIQIQYTLINRRIDALFKIALNQNSNER